jgi:hypothetical protein
MSHFARRLSLSALCLVAMALAVPNVAAAQPGGDTGADATSLDALRVAKQKKVRTLKRTARAACVHSASSQTCRRERRRLRRARRSLARVVAHSAASATSAPVLSATCSPSA